MALEEYRRKRHFTETPEPSGRARRKRDAHRFVVQEHHASHLHYDFRLEIGGVLKSWAIPKGPSMDPATRRLAVQTEDHPIEYGTFEGTIPEGSYGAGEVILWDHGTFDPESPDPEEALREGHLSFALHGEKLKGGFSLICTGCRGDEDRERWLLIKKHDEFARAGDVAAPERSGEGRRESGKAARSRRSTGADPSEEAGQSGETRPSRGARAGASGAGEDARAPHKGAGRHRRAHASAGSGADPLSLEEFLDLREPKGDVTVAVSGEAVPFTHLDRVYWPAEGISKGRLLQYYARVGETILPYLRGRPAILKRRPRGIAAPGFFQHDLPEAPEWVQTVPLETEEGRTIHYFVYTHLASLLYLVNLGTIEQHPWHSRTDDLEHPDYLVLDLDPHETSFAVVLQVALGARRVLDDLGLRGYPKTSGARGAHVYVPLGRRLDYDEAAGLSEEISRRVVARCPEIATGERMLRARERGKVYVDWVQNARGKSAAAAYSVRGRPGAPVSTPLTWEEVARGVEPARFTLDTVPPRLAREGDPWAGILVGHPRLERALKLAA